METPDILNSKSARGLIKGSLLLIGLFAVLYCGVAVFLLNFEDKIETNKNNETIKNIETIKNTEENKNSETNKEIENINNNIEISKKFDCKIFILFLILIIIPLIIFFLVFFKFSHLIKSYYKKLYGSSCDDGVYFKIKNLEIERLKIENLEKENLEKQNLEIQKLQIENLEKQNREKYKYKMQEIEAMIESYKIAIETIKSDQGKEAINKILEKMLEIFSKKDSEEK